MCYRSRVSVCETQTIHVLLHLSENVVTLIQNFPQNLQRRSQSSCSCLLHATFDFLALNDLLLQNIWKRFRTRCSGTNRLCTTLSQSHSRLCFRPQWSGKESWWHFGITIRNTMHSLIRVYLFSCISIFLSRSGSQLCSACCSFLTFLLLLGCKEMANIRDVINGFIFPEGWPAVLFSTSSFHCLCRCTSV